MDEAKKVFSSVEFADSIDDCISDTDVMILLTEWDEFLSLDFKKVVDLMNENAIIIDTRDQYPKKAVERAGVKYIGIGL
jgi:UDPglucose 6-dehydrogenase